MKVAFVTGSNKGIGLGIVEKLVKHFDTKHDWDVYLTARNPVLGQTAVEELQNKGLHAKFHQLDITDVNSRRNFLQFLKRKYPDGINIAVNNAGIAHKDDSQMSFAEQARAIMHTNYTSTVNFTLEFLPHLATNARVVHLSSLVSHSTLKKLGKDLHLQFTSPMSLMELTGLANEFIRHAEAGDHELCGWPSTAYGVSKLFLTKASYVIGDSLSNDARNIIMNSCCPGYVKTDMTNHRGVKTIEQGADTPFYLATLPPEATEPINEFVCNRKIKKWPTAM